MKYFEDFGTSFFLFFTKFKVCPLNQTSKLHFVFVLFKADACSGSPASGSGIGTECDTLKTDGTCTQMCTTGYSDNNSGNGQDYTCVDGTWAGTALVCSGILVEPNKSKNKLPNHLIVHYFNCMSISLTDQIYSDQYVTCMFFSKHFVVLNIIIIEEYSRNFDCIQIKTVFREEHVSWLALIRSWLDSKNFQ